MIVAIKVKILAEIFIFLPYLIYFSGQVLKNVQTLWCRTSKLSHMFTSIQILGHQTKYYQQN